MLSDRPYMRDNFGHSAFSALTWLICSIAGGFVVENIFLRWFGGEAWIRFFDVLTLSTHGISKGFAWTLLTHSLIHDHNGLFHLVFVLLAIFVFGRAVLSQIGPRRFLMVFTAAVAVGGLSWLAIPANWGNGQHLYGASAGVSALVVLFACLAPQQPITFFLIDIGMKAKHLAFGLLTINLLGLVLLEIPGSQSWFAMSHSAQLGGMLTGWLFFRFVHEHGWESFKQKPAVELPRWFRKTQKAETPAPVFKVNLGSGDDLRAEIDRILDKINSEGFHSLTAEEKYRLDHARDHLSRR